MKSIGKARRATTAAMDSPYRIGFDVGRQGKTAAALNPYPVASPDYYDWAIGQAKGYELYLACQKTKEDLS